MKQGQFDQIKKINPDLLSDEMQDALGSKFISMDTGVKVKIGFEEKTVILVRLTDDATAEDQTLAEDVIADHTPDKLSRSQQRDKEKQEAEARFKALDFAALRALSGKEQTDAIINLLEDLHKILHKDA